MVVDKLIENPRVGGSIPSPATIWWVVVKCIKQGLRAIVALFLCPRRLRVLPLQSARARQSRSGCFRAALRRLESI